MSDPSQGASSQGQLDQELIPAFRLLLRAYECDVAGGLWELAVEIDSLRDRGLLNTHLRWLILKGYAEHRIETTSPGEDHRNFLPTNGNYVFSDHSCFILTDSGAAFARDAMERAFVAGDAALLAEISPIVRLQAAQEMSQPLTRDNHYAGNGSFHAAQQVPRWNPDRKELRLGGLLVKQFKVPSINQETILVTFEEEGWPARIDDPLPARPGVSPKSRLHNTIKSLNRNQRHRLVRFMGDGTGQGVCWERFEFGSTNESARDNGNITE